MPYLSDTLEMSKKMPQAFLSLIRASLIFCPSIVANSRLLVGNQVVSL